ncbi:MAG: HD-GYP domain-containing protein [Thermoleophilaceae bacterium]|nr:HD-GYP domain-containing protein [Thermoleophilaceae bacterium]
MHYEVLDKGQMANDDSASWQGLKAEAQQTFIWVGRLAAFAWLLGTVLASIYMVSTDVITADALILLGLCSLGFIASLIIPWYRADRWWVLPMIAYATVVIAAGTVVLNKPGISAFHLFALLFLAFFYWGRWDVMITGYLLWSAVFITAEFLRPGPVNLEQLLVAMPTYIATSAMVGILANRVRGISRTERRRFKATVEALCAALSARDGYTGEHSAETLELVNSVTDQLDLPLHEVETISDVALLHDIGKIGIPNEVLHEPGKLNDAQWEIMKQHPVIGERIVARIPGLESVAQAIRHEHERWDGHGYPDGLKGTSIPLASRIVLVCDAFHAMTSDRPYREAMPVEEARAELVRHAGTQFDPVIVNALLSSLDIQADKDAAATDPAAAKLIDDTFESSGALQSV